MTRTEAENLILNAEGRLCVRFYKRADGSILTKDCPVGWQAIKRRISRTAAAALFLCFSDCSAAWVLQRLLIHPTKEVKVGRFLAGFFFDDRIRQSLMGNISVPTPTPKAATTPNYHVVGVIANTPRKDMDYTMGKPAVSKN